MRTIQLTQKEQSPFYYAPAMGSSAEGSRTDKQCLNSNNIEFLKKKTII